MKVPIFILTCIVPLCLSCGPMISTKPTADNYVKLSPSGEVEVEAYLLDSRIYRDGKPTSVRLELYRTDTAIALAGRGYLGKGALKGVITRDSVIIYFPASNEYVRSGRNDFLSSATCAGGFEKLQIEQLLTALPNENTLAPAAVRGEIDGDRAEYRLLWPDCDWSLQLRYRERDDRWRIDRVDFEDGDDIRFKAETRIIKDAVDVDRQKFSVRIPLNATPLDR